MSRTPWQFLAAVAALPLILPSAVAAGPPDPSKVATGGMLHGCPYGYVCLFEHPNYNDNARGTIVMNTEWETGCLSKGDLGGLIAGQVRSVVNNTSATWHVWQGGFANTGCWGASAPLYAFSSGNMDDTWRDQVYAISR
jgi:hypothetical protein